MDNPILYYLAAAFLILGAGAGVLLILWQRREKQLAALARKLGLRFRPEQDEALVDRFRFLDKIVKADRRYVYNVMHGFHRKYCVYCFDFLRRSTHQDDSYRTTAIVLLLDKPFPEVTITEANPLSNIGRLFALSKSITFESHEFSSAFSVRSADKRFAYDICHPRMMEYLLQNKDLQLEIEEDALAMLFEDVISPEEIEYNLDRIVEVRRLFPEYLFSSSISYAR